MRKQKGVDRVKISFEIPGEFPGMNEIVTAAKQHFGTYSGMKQTFTDLVCWTAPRNHQFAGPVKVSMEWYSKNRKRDPDNIMAGQKFIFDGLVNSKVILNDTQKYIVEIEHRFKVDSKNPRVIVEVEEID